MKLPTLILPLLVLTSTACAQKLAPEALSTRLEQLATTGDTAALASLAARQCRGGAADVSRQCYEDYFLQLAKGERVQLALGALERLGKEDPQVQSDATPISSVSGPGSPAMMCQHGSAAATACFNQDAITVSFSRGSHSRARSTRPAPTSFAT
jgi:hypothetical protein